MVRNERNDDAGDASHGLSLSAQSPYANSILCPRNFRTVLCGGRSVMSVPTAIRNFRPILYNFLFLWGLDIPYARYSREGNISYE
jgi:hypothetical protein